MKDASAINLISVSGPRRLNASQLESHVIIARSTKITPHGKGVWHFYISAIYLHKEMIYHEIEKKQNRNPFKSCGENKLGHFMPSTDKWRRKAKPELHYLP